jgi:hypothetical protein
VDFTDGADGAIVDHFDEFADRVGGVTLIAELRRDAGFARGVGDAADIVKGMGEGFFAVDVFAHADGPHDDGGVHVIGCGDDDGVDVSADVVEHDAEILEDAGPGIGFGCFGGSVPIHVAQGDDVFGFEPVEIGVAATADADEGEVESVIGGGAGGSAENTCRDDGEGAGDGGSTQEKAT